MQMQEVFCLASQPPMLLPISTHKGSWFHTHLVVMVHHVVFTPALLWISCAGQAQLLRLAFICKRQTVCSLI